MKRIAGFFLFTVFCLFPIWGNAGIIGNANLQLFYSSPGGNATFPTLGNANWVLDYDVSLNFGARQEAFCVENASGPSQGVSNSYTLLSIDSGLSAFFASGVNVNKYLAAAWVAQNYITNLPDTTEAEKASAQIAIWEIIFDYGSYDLSSGNFRSYNSFNLGAAAILANIPTSPGPSSNWALAVNPTITADGQVNLAAYQNYLVQYKVPEPVSLLLLGIGLVGIAGIRRKMKN
jgi:hypothetical protein